MRKSTIGDRRSKFLESIDVSPIDQDAFTIEEICEAKGIDRFAAEALARDNVQMGSWEKVRKRGKQRMQSAYRLKESRTTN